MAKKVRVNPRVRAGTIISDEGVVEIGGVRYTPESPRNPNIAVVAAENEAVHPLVDAHVLEAQDGNDGKHDGSQDSFKMPPFANGRDMRHRG